MDYPILWLSSTTTLPITPLLEEVNADLMLRNLL